MALSLQTEGDKILSKYCAGFPTSNTTSSFVLPPYNLVKHVEALSIAPNPNLSPNELKKFQGLRTGQTGELAEREVFYNIHELSGKLQTHPFLSIHSLDLDTKCKGFPKSRQLKKEFPEEVLRDAKTNIELDALVFIRNVGVIGIEVKSSSKENSISTAERQLTGGQELFTALMSAIEKKPRSTLPYVRVICVLNDSSPSPPSSMKTDSYRLNRDIISDQSKFEGMWNIFVKDLLVQRKNSTFSNPNFDVFTKTIVGLWASKRGPSGLVFDHMKASVLRGVEVADEKVKTGVLATNERSKPLADNLSYNDPGTIPRESEELELVYFTMEQTSLFYHHKHALVRGVAGAGKSLLVLMKIIEIVRRDPKSNVLLVTPFPFNIRCSNILTANHVTNKVITSFPSQSSHMNPPINVIIMSLDDFFKVTPDKLQSYNLQSYHIFVDDLQNLLTTADSMATYFDIGIFVETLFLQRKASSLYLWICSDILQSETCNFDDTDITSLCYDTDMKLRPLTIPPFELHAILRNTYDIIEMVQDIRKERIQATCLTPDHTITATPGQTIANTPITYQKLKERTPAKYQESFMLKMLKIELDLLILDLDKCLRLAPSDIAILYDGMDLDEPIRNFVSSTYKPITTQTVEECERNSNKAAIICDKRDNISSFEFPCVIFVRYYSTLDQYTFHNLVTRARSRLTVIDCHVKQPAITSKNIHVTMWNVNANSRQIEMC